jgi:hypothetical protein
MLTLELSGNYKMAKNTGQNYRKGAVSNRSQVYNPLTEKWVKRDTETGKFLGQKSDGTAFKGVAKEVDDRRTDK